MERKENNSSSVPESLDKEISGLIISVSVITRHISISSMVLYTDRKFRIYVLTVKLFCICNECMVLIINNVLEITKMSS